MSGLQTDIEFVAETHPVDCISNGITVTFEQQAEVEVIEVVLAEFRQTQVTKTTAKLTSGDETTSQLIEITEKLGDLMGADLRVVSE